MPFPALLPLIMKAAPMLLSVLGSKGEGGGEQAQQQPQQPEPQLSDPWLGLAQSTLQNNQAAEMRKRMIQESLMRGQ